MNDDNKIYAKDIIKMFQDLINSGCKGYVETGGKVIPIQSFKMQVPRYWYVEYIEEMNKG